MLDQPDKRARRRHRLTGPALDFQQHLARWRRPGCCVRIDRPIDKDTELHPLVRWQFQGGLPEDKRRAFLFTNVVDGSGRRYDMPVVVGALRPRRRSTPSAWASRSRRSAAPGSTPIAHPIPPVRCHRRACQEVVITGDDLRSAGRRAEAPAGADLDAGLRRRALSHRHALRHQGSRERHPEHGHLSRRS